MNVVTFPVRADPAPRQSERREKALGLRELRYFLSVADTGNLGRAARDLNVSQPAISLQLLERVNYGAFVARRTGLPVAVSGSPEETLAMSASLARDFGIRTHWVEERSRDTFENAKFCAQLLEPLGVTRIVLVTDAGHEWRAMQEFVSAGFSVVPAPVGLSVPRELGPGSFLPNVHALAYSTEALYEILGDLARRAFATLHLRRHSR